MTLLVLMWHAYIKLSAYTPCSILHTPWSRVLLEKQTGSQLVKKFPALHRTQRFITAFSPFSKPDQSSPCPPIPLPEDVILPSTPRSSKWSLSSRLNKIQQFSFTLLAPWNHSIFSKSSISPYTAASIPDKKWYLYWRVQESRCRDNVCSLSCISEASISYF